MAASGTTTRKIPDVSMHHTYYLRALHSGQELKWTLLWSSNGSRTDWQSPDTEHISW